MNAKERRLLRREQERKKREREGGDGSAPPKKRMKGAAGGNGAGRANPFIVFVGQLAFSTTAEGIEEHFKTRFVVYTHVTRCFSFSNPGKCDVASTGRNEKNCQSVVYRPSDLTERATRFTKQTTGSCSSLFAKIIICSSRYAMALPRHVLRAPNRQSWVVTVSSPCGGASCFADSRSW